MVLNPFLSVKCADLLESQPKITMEQTESVKYQVSISPDHVNVDLLEKDRTFPLFTEMSSQISMDDGLAELDLGKDFHPSFMEYASSSNITHNNSYLDDICLLEDVTQLTLPVVNDTTAENLISSSVEHCEIEPISTDVTNVMTSVTDHTQIVEFPPTVANLCELLGSDNIDQLDQNETFHNLRTLLQQTAFTDSTSEVFETLTLHAVQESPTVVEVENSESITNIHTEIKHEQEGKSAVDNSPASISEIVEPITKPKSTHDKYMEMRRKNNIASRRSRQARKEKDHALELKAVEMEKENCILKAKVKQLEKQRDAFKKHLIHIVSTR